MDEDITKSEKSQECRDNLESNTVIKIDNNVVAGNNGLYDVEKCRAYIAHQIRVSKIDRFSIQVTKAIEIESGMKSRLSNILNMFMKSSAQVAHEFTSKCKLGLQHHRQDRILNHQKKPSKRGKVTPVNHRYPDRLKQANSAISNDLLYGTGAQLVRKLVTFSRHIKRKHDDDQMSLSDDDYLLSDLFEPSTFVKQLEVFIRNNLKRSSTITMQLNTIRQLFEKLASGHRDRVDIVYAAEEERQADTVIRRSAYNLSMAAFKATSTPVHINTTNEIHS